MINIDDLKPILEPLMEGREDSVSVIEAITAIDRDLQDTTAEAVAAAVAAKDSEWADRYRKSFFNPDATDATGGAGNGDTTTTHVDDHVTDPEDLDYEDILQEVK